jgi:hypothetical protein
VRYIIGDGSKFGDETSIIGRMRRTLIEHQMEPGDRHNKDMIAASLKTLEILVEQIKEVADI